MEGKEVRFGSAGCGLFAGSTTGTSTGAVNCFHDSMTPGGGAVPLVNMMFGEVSPGGTGSGLYGMLVFAILSVFIAGLMVGRTPEYLGKKIQAPEMKLIVLYLILMPLIVLAFAGGRRAARHREEFDLQSRDRTVSPRSRTRSRRPATTTARPSAVSPATPIGTTRRSVSRCSPAGSC